ncbi:helix-turn-helix domain-containing protein [Streptomyces sp. Iso 434]|uniref:helix-turn-helix domain-containing protein n=1 Tax=Streptomyces sp. Iso 434 TaxID=3062272 RepID=UPI00397F421D
MGFDPSYVSHVESGRHKPTEDFARRAEEALNAGKAIWKRWLDYELAKPPRYRRQPHRPPAGSSSRTRRARRSSWSTMPPVWTTTAVSTGSRCAGCCGTRAMSRSPAT